MTPNERALAKVQEQLAGAKPDDQAAADALKSFRDSIKKQAEEQKAAVDSMRGRNTGDKPRPWEPSKDLLKMIEKAVEDSLKPVKDHPFKSQVETGSSMFQRIQSGAASEHPEEKQMLTLTQRLVQIQEEDKRKRDLTNQLLQQIRDKQIPGAVAQ
jgi:hypothetical protein